MEPTKTVDVSDQRRVFFVTIAATAGLGVLAYVLSLTLKTPLDEQFYWSFMDALKGVSATLPLVLFLWWFTRTDHPGLAAFRQSQIKFFSEIGFDFTLPRIVIISIAAGLFEELLFRGVFQSWVASFAPIAVALIVTNILFGLLHMRTLLYAVIAGLVGVYLGIIYAVVDNLLTPMIAHGLYDFVALYYTRLAVEAYRAELAANPALESSADI